VLLGKVFTFFVGSLLCAAADSVRIFIVGKAVRGGAAGGLVILVNICISYLLSIGRVSLRDIPLVLFKEVQAQALLIYDFMLGARLLSGVDKRRFGPWPQVSGQLLGGPPRTRCYCEQVPVLYSISFQRSSLLVPVFGSCVNVAR